MQEDRMIVFFDGHCLLCSRWVKFLLKGDKKRVFHFAPLQGSTATKLLSSKEKIELPDSIIFFKQGKITHSSEAVFEILGLLPFPFRALCLFSVLPTSINNKIYRLVANNRYRWFGKSQQCFLPTQEELHRFLA